MNRLRIASPQGLDVPSSPVPVVGDQAAVSSRHRSTGAAECPDDRPEDARPGRWARGRPAPARACPSPGFNGAHYYSEVDPVTLAPAAASGYLRCRWCGGTIWAPSFADESDPVRVIREVSPSESFRAVREAIW